MEPRRGPNRDDRKGRSTRLFPPHFPQPQDAAEHVGPKWCLQMQYYGGTSGLADCYHLPHLGLLPMECEWIVPWDQQLGASSLTLALTPTQIDSDVRGRDNLSSTNSTPLDSRRLQLGSSTSGDQNYSTEPSINRRPQDPYPREESISTWPCQIVIRRWHRAVPK